MVGAGTVTPAVVLPWPDSPVVPKCPPRAPCAQQPGDDVDGRVSAAPAVGAQGEQEVRTELGQVGDLVRVSAVSAVPARRPGARPPATRTCTVVWGAGARRPLFEPCRRLRSRRCCRGCRAPPVQEFVRHPKFSTVNALTGARALACVAAPSASVAQARGCPGGDDPLRRSAGPQGRLWRVVGAL